MKKIVYPNESDVQIIKKILKDFILQDLAIVTLNYIIYSEEVEIYSEYFEGLRNYIKFRNYKFLYWINDAKNKLINLRVCGNRHNQTFKYFNSEDGCFGVQWADLCTINLLLTINREEPIFVESPTTALYSRICKNHHKSTELLHYYLTCKQIVCEFSSLVKTGCHFTFIVNDPMEFINVINIFKITLRQLYPFLEL